MDTQHHPRTHVHDPAQGHDERAHNGHRWMMIVCCIPMLAIAGILLATEVVSPAS